MPIMQSLKRAVDILAGPERPGTGEFYTPLLQPDDLVDRGYLAKRKIDIKRRADHLLTCGLHVYDKHFDLAVAIVTSRNSWKDENLRHTTVDHRAIREDEREAFARDDGIIWQKLRNQPWPMIWLLMVCGLGAMVQGWDEAAVNGAQVYYSKAFGIDPNDPYIGYINGAPYACCFFSCWLSWPLNNLWGRRTTIFLASLCSAAFALGEAFAVDWQTMLILRALLGLGIGPKSVTIPIFASEVAPAELRGALVMVWQLFTALGIMLGYLSGVVFANVKDANDALSGNRICTDLPYPLNCTLNWRLMIASPVVAPVCLCFLIFMQPESPRWLIAKAQRKEIYNERVLKKNAEVLEQDRYPPKVIDLQPVFKSLVRLRGNCKLKAARDMLSIDVLLWEQREKNERAKNKNKGKSSSGSSPIREEVAGATSLKEDSRRSRLLRTLKRAQQETWQLLSKPRNNRALIASLIVMFLQQYCGINVLIYYSTLVLFQSKVDGQECRAIEPPERYPGSEIPIFIVQSCIIGAINFLCGLPALFLIDHRGRRSLLLRTFPFLTISAAIVAIGNAPALTNSQYQEPLILAGMYLFVIFYSVGEGPVPFVYASESFPQDIRDLGMAVVTSLNWAFNFAVAVSYPRMSACDALGRHGTFAFYSSMCFVGFWLIYFFVPETCQKELELLDEVFEENLLSFAWQNLRRLFAFLPYPRRKSDLENDSDSDDDSRSGSRQRRRHQRSQPDQPDISSGSSRPRMESEMVMSGSTARHDNRASGESIGIAVLTSSRFVSSQLHQESLGIVHRGTEVNEE